MMVTPRELARKVLVAEEKRADRRGAKTQQNEDDGEAGDEQEAASKHLQIETPGASGRPSAGDRGQVAGHERQAAGRDERDQASREREQDAG